MANPMIVSLAALLAACLVASSSEAATTRLALERTRAYNQRPGEEAFQIPPVDKELAEKNAQQSARFGLPSTDNLKLFNSFLLSYDRRLKGPAWVLEHLTSKNFAGAADRQRAFFKEDSTIHEYFQAKNADYINSDYDRGHQASAGDHTHDQTAQDQTFSLSNVWPQVPEMNQGGWVRIEHYIRALATNPDVANVYVVTGPLFLSHVDEKTGERYVRYPVIGSSKVAVPTDFYKVILMERTNGQLVMEAFSMPNTQESHADIESINKYRVPIEQLPQLERAAGVIFFDQVNRNQVEQPTSLQYNYVDKKIVFNN